MTIHTRSVILLMGIAVIIVVYWFIYKEWLISLKTIPYCIICVFIAKYCIKLVQNIVWKMNERSSVANTSINLGIGGINWIDINTWKSFGLVFLGQINSINLFSGGLFLMSFYIILKYFIKNIDTLIIKSEKNRYYLVLSIGFILCCLGMVAGQALSWNYAIYPDIVNNATGKVYGYKAFSYVRYMGAFIGPFILCSMIITQKKDGFIKNIDIIRIILLQLLVIILWSKFVLPLLDGNPYALEVYAPFCFRKAHEAVNIEQYRMAIPWILLIITFVLSVMLFKNSNYYYIFALILLIFQVSYMAKYNDSYYGKERSLAAATCYDFFKELKLYNADVPETIYSFQIDKQRLQFYLNDYKIIPNIPEDIGTDTILVYQGKISDLEEQELKINEWNYVFLGNSTYILFQREDYINIIQTMGYEVVDSN